MPSPEDLRALAARLEREAEEEMASAQRKIEQAQELRREADATEAKLLRAIQAIEGGLSSDGDQRTVTGTEMEAQNTAVTVRGRKKKKLTPGEEQRRLGIAKARGSDHPFPQALYKRGSFVARWAAEHGLDRNEVKSWFSKKAPRPIPERYAREIRATLGVPFSAWERGTKPDPET